LVKYVISKYFLSVCSLSFHSFNSVFLVVLGIEFRVLCLLGRYPTT
jgi:hypothetical protein